MVMIYSCISCNAVSSGPKCVACIRKDHARLAAERLANLSTAMRDVHVPIEYLDVTDEDVDTFGPGDDYLVIGKNRNRKAAAMLRVTMQETAKDRAYRGTDWWRAFRYTSVADMFNAMKASMDAGFSDAPVIAEVSTVPFLVLADVGCEAVTPWSAAKLNNLLTMRRERGKATIVTTFLSAGQTKALYGDVHGPALVQLLEKYHQVKA